MKQLLAGFLTYTTFADRMLLLVLGLLSFSSLILPLHFAPGKEYVVEIDGQVKFAGKLGEPRHLDVKAPLGIVRLEIGERGIRVAASACPQQICVRQGWIRYAGQLIVCVPNKLIITVTGGNSDANMGPLDRVTR